MRIYQADVWCDACGEAIERRLTAEGKRPADVCDPASYDSDNYPKMADDRDEADSPQHCAAGEACLDPTEIEGRQYGHFMANDLTSDGVQYVRDAAERGGTVALFWARYYDLLCCGDRLTDHPCGVCGRVVRERDCDGNGCHDDCDDARP